MYLKNFAKLLSILTVLVFLGTVSADSGPIIERAQATALAQDYLDSKGLPYTAMTPAYSDWKAKVRVNKTGEVKWIPFGEYKEDAFEGTGKYEYIADAWVVRVRDSSGNIVGTIYVDAESGKIISAKIDGKTETGSSGGKPLTYTGNGTGTEEAQGGILEAIQSFINSIIQFFQNLFGSVTG